MTEGKKIKIKRVFFAGLLAFAAAFLFTGPWAAREIAMGAALDEAAGHLGAPVAMDASYGFDNMAKGGRYLPVYVTLENLEEETFSGDIRVLSMESDYNIYQYEFPIALEGGEFVQKNLILQML